jgi:endonuclease YncB( thermonuclease family)
MIRKMRILAYFLILNLTLISKASLQEVRVIDGDSLVIENKKYRLFGIDAPEMQQICFR